MKFVKNLDSVYINSSLLIYFLRQFLHVLLDQHFVNEHLISVAESNVYYSCVSTTLIIKWFGIWNKSKQLHKRHLSTDITKHLNIHCSYEIDSHSAWNVIRFRSCFCWKSTDGAFSNHWYLMSIDLLDRSNSCLSRSIAAVFDGILGIFHGSLTVPTRQIHQRTEIVRTDKILEDENFVDFSYAHKVLWLLSSSTWNLHFFSSMLLMLLTIGV